MSHLSITINISLRIVNVSVSFGILPVSYKTAIIFPLFQKQCLDSQILKKNYRPAASLAAYKAFHSCKTALLRVYDDTVTTIGSSNGAMLVLID